MDSADTCAGGQWDPTAQFESLPDGAHQIRSANIALAGDNLVLTMTTQATIPAPDGGLSVDAWSLEVADPANQNSEYVYAASPGQNAGEWAVGGSYYPNFQNGNSFSQPESATGTVKGNQVLITVPISELTNLPSHPLWKATIITSGGSWDCPSGITNLQASDIGLPGSDGSNATTRPTVQASNPDLLYVIGDSLPVAEQLLKADGYTSMELQDATGQGRTPIFDENWKVVSERPPPNQPAAPSTKVVLGVQKFSDP